jgi:hypothetical protein
MQRLTARSHRCFGYCRCQLDEMRQQRLVDGTLRPSFSAVMSLKINMLSVFIFRCCRCRLRGNGAGSHRTAAQLLTLCLLWSICVVSRLCRAPLDRVAPLLEIVRYMMGVLDSAVIDLNHCHCDQCPRYLWAGAPAGKLRLFAPCLFAR